MAPCGASQEFPYLRAMKRILYDMGLLTLVRWPLQRALKFVPPFGPEHDFHGDIAIISPVHFGYFCVPRTGLGLYNGQLRQLLVLRI